MDNIDRALITMQLSTYWITVWMLLSRVHKYGLIGYSLVIILLIINTIMLGDTMKYVDKYK